MTYKINSMRIIDETIFVDTTFILKDNTEVNTEVAIFSPKDKDEVLQSIANREISEQTKYNACVSNEIIRIEMDEIIGKECSFINGKININ